MKELMSYRKLTRDEHFTLAGPKRILALDGGGLRGILSLGFLDRIETLLRGRHGSDPEFRLAHYFDLIAGTSTGAIIAAALAEGLSVSEVTQKYMSLGRRVFKKSFFRRGIFRAKYHHAKLVEQLQVVLGEETRLGSDLLQTGLLVLTKRMDTGSPWPLGNNPRGAYFRARDDADWISNADYPLWKVVRASTAAPSFFDPQKITIATIPGHQPAFGYFVDGGVSPFNNPALQAFMYATLDGFNVGWQTGADKLLVVSVGTGSKDVGREFSRIAAKGAMSALQALMDDCGALVETVMQWMSASPMAREIDSEVGTLRDDLLAEEPLFTYLRYDLDLTRDAIEPLKPGFSDDLIDSLGAMDDPDNLQILRELGELGAKRQLREEHFPSHFDLPA